MSSTNKTMPILLMTSLSLVLAAAWYLAPHPAIVVVLCFVPLGALFVLNQTFWLVSLFVLFSFFRIHEAIPEIGRGVV